MKKAAKKEGPQQKQGPSSAVVLGSSVASVSLRREIRVTLRASQCGCTLSQLINVNWCGGSSWARKDANPLSVRIATRSIASSESKSVLKLIARQPARHVAAHFRLAKASLSSSIFCCGRAGAFSGGDAANSKRDQSLRKDQSPRKGASTKKDEAAN